MINMFKRECEQNGRERIIFEFVSDGDLAPEAGAKKIGIPVDELEKRMEEAGMPIPTSV